MINLHSPADKTAFSFFSGLTRKNLSFVLICVAVSFASTSQAISNNSDPTIPPEYLPPNAPDIALARTSNSITVNMPDSSLYESGYFIQKKSANNQWMTIQTSGPLHSSQSLSVTSSNLTPDTRYCFRAGTYNYIGTRYSKIECAYTFDENDYPVWRVQLAIETGDAYQAGTDDTVWVRLNSASQYELPRGNLTVVDYPSADFSRASIHTVDLNSNGISQLSDINQISINKSGMDDWCVKSVRLLVNNQDVYAQDYSGLSAGCHQVQSTWGPFGMLQLNKAQLRASTDWQNYDQAFSLGLLGNNGINNIELVSRLSGMIGHMMNYNELNWRDNNEAPVTVSLGCASAADCNRVNVDLNMKADANILDLGTLHPNVDINFDMVVECGTNSLIIQTENFDVSADSSFVVEVLSIGVVNYIDGKVEDAIRDAWEAISQSVDGIPQCEVQMNQYGDVFLLQAE